jgi:hypothetical protein
VSTPVLPSIMTVSRFSDDKLQSAIDRALADLPPDKTGSLVAHMDTTGAVLTVVERLGGVWSVRAGAIYPFGGKLSAEAEVVVSW